MPNATKEAVVQTLAQKNLAAECRFVEEGHHVRIDHERGVFLVKSDTTDRTYEVTAHAVQLADGRLLAIFGCTCPAGARQAPVGSVGCKHSAGIARRLEREGLLTFDGRVWVATATATEHAAAPAPEGACPICGLVLTVGRCDAADTWQVVPQHRMSDQQRKHYVLALVQ